ncbi:F-box domain [Arabidopsis thaliana x Arabidopsis arenosa]|uniref:F-box domain n=1 Tax=Arabidopsis thaliana x Arabidopsis arenosa TaxID=1240361 RepID=A0A8T2AWR4_9BRAS|nr:F-box domain [Arabidopsis thaliana x Arabidopsis arenosa]
MTIISDLPWDLVEEILSKTSITSLRAIGSTCKRWNTLSKDESFRKNHCGKASKEFLLNMTCHYDYESDQISPTRFNLQNIKDLPSSLKKIGNNDMLCPFTIFNVYQCDGLLLLVTTDNLRVVVWNPYLAQTRWIETQNKRLVTDLYAIGYDNKNNHKVMWFSSMLFVKHKIYDFKSNSWRVLDITCDCSFRRGASLKGNTYFVAKNEKEIICFDFTTERFGPCMNLPFDFDGTDVTLSCVREEQLAVFVHSCWTGTYSMEIWITTKIEPNAVSWSKFLEVEVQDVYGSFLSQFEVYSFFIDKEKKVAVVSGGDCDSFGYHTSIVVGKDGCIEKTDLGDVLSYVPSSVQIL